MDPRWVDRLHASQTRHWWYQARRALLAQAIDDLEPELLRRAVLYDLGCGVGANLGLLEARGTAVGIDSSTQAVEYCRARGHRDVRVGSLERLGALPADSGALVLLADVLEHLDDDRSAIDAIHRLLVPSGALVITVPAFPMLWGPADDLAHHRRRYSARELRALLEPRLAVLRMTHFNTLLFGPIALGRFVQRMAHASGDSEGKVPPAVINRALGVVMAGERHLLRHMNFALGVSILCVARKVAREV